jgi:oligoribonuclease
MAAALARAMAAPMADTGARFVWLGLELTGLDDKTCSIIEMAMIITDGDLNDVAMIEQCIWQPDSALETMSPFVRQMHTDNGLLEKVRASKLSQQDAEQKALELLTQHVPFKKGVLAGNSIWQDRRFLLRHMPFFENHLHYRQIDVSTIKVLSKQWYGARGEAPGKPSSHTALEDIRASIAELKWYRDHCFSLVPNA